MLKPLLSDGLEQVTIYNDLTISDGPPESSNGASGILMLLSTVLELAIRSNNPLPVENQMKRSIVSSLHRGAYLVYRHGFLRKGLGLCHGEVTGSFYALLAMADVSKETTGQLDYLAAAMHLPALTTLVEQREMRMPDRCWAEGCDIMNPLT